MVISLGGELADRSSNYARELGILDVCVSAATGEQL